MKERFTNCYSLSKTLRFKLIPIGKTQESIERKSILAEDEERANNILTAKAIINRFHVSFIDSVLSLYRIDGLEEYCALFLKKNKSDSEKQNMLEREVSMRKGIAEAFKKDKSYKSLFDKTLFSDVLPGFVSGEEVDVVNSFNGFTTALKGFYENRSNMYSEEPKASAISYRIVNENLPKFLNNIRVFEMVKTILGVDDVAEIEKSILGEDYRIEELFIPDFFNYVLTQKGIDVYNAVIGGFVDKKDNKIKGLNEYINLYNQEHKDKMPPLTMLYKQVLSDREGRSYYSEGFTNDNEVREALRTQIFENEDLAIGIENLQKLFCGIGKEFPLSGVYVLNGQKINKLSKDILGDWSAFRDAWGDRYDSAKDDKEKKNPEKYELQKRNEFKKIESISLEEFVGLCCNQNESKTALSDIICEKIRYFMHTFDVARGGFDDNSIIKGNDEQIAKIKNLLDSIKDLEDYVKVFKGTEKEDNRDLAFYGKFMGILETLSELDSLYNAIRNYVTQKPYSKEKFKLYFQTPTFLNGWDINKEESNHAIILFHDGRYYLGIVDKNNVKCLRDLKEDSDGENYDKMCYRLLPGPNKMLPKVFLASSKWENEYGVPAEIKKIYKEKSFVKGETFSVENCRKMIDYFKGCIPLYSDWSQSFNFLFSPTESYEDISGFYREVEEQGYSIKTSKVSMKGITQLVDEGKLYLFQIYNKDFSEKSHGRENLHTMFFKSIFSVDNNGVIRLNGEAEMFLRRASIKRENLVIHPAGKAMNNKNPNNPKKTTTLSYDVVKDRRYTVDQYEFHVPITINKCPKNQYLINNKVREYLRLNPNQYIIGIDRGERNLLYVVVIDGSGNIIEQFSLNEIINETNGVTIKTDYHELLDRKEKERAAARQNWTAIENIKELKEGYISQVVHKICSLVEKYDAVIALEDLNSGFKNSRAKVEKQVYQKFEKMLIDKLNYMVDKQKNPLEAGGVLNGYQLTLAFDGFKNMGTQNGIMFYIPAWLTSKIDPTTGFTNLFRIKYTNIAEAKAFFSKFDCICYDTKTCMFRFDFDYSNFAYAEADYQKKWSIYSNDSRIRIFRNQKKNNEFDHEEVNLTRAFEKLFSQYHISYDSGNDIKTQICEVNEKEFFVEFLYIFKLTLQMRNSISGRVDVDYLISPVMNKSGKFFDSRKVLMEDIVRLPKDADANGAYNIARKVLWAIDRFKESDLESVGKVKIAISNKEWLKYAQKNAVN